MYEFVERYGFSATHRVHSAGACHASAGAHLHRWVIEIVLMASQLPPVSHPSELVELEPVRRYVAWELDGKHLNDVLPVAPTPAYIAGHMANWCRTNLTGYAGAAFRSVAVSTERHFRVRYLVNRRR